MSAEHPFWEIWAKTLRHWGMHTLAASLLEAAGPLTTLGAQVLYLIQPVLSSIMHRNHTGALDTMLNNHAETQQFIIFLRENSVP